MQKPLIRLSLLALLALFCSGSIAAKSLDIPEKDLACFTLSDEQYSSNPNCVELDKRLYEAAKSYAIHEDEFEDFYKCFYLDNADSCYEFADDVDFEITESMRPAIAQYYIKACRMGESNSCELAIEHMVELLPVAEHSERYVQFCVTGHDDACEMIEDTFPVESNIAYYTKLCLNNVTFSCEALEDIDQRPEFPGQRNIYWAIDYFSSAQKTDPTQ